MFDAENVALYNIFPEDNLYVGLYKLLPKKVNKYLRYCYYKKKIALRADFIFVKYYNLLVRLLHTQIFDVVILQNPLSLKAVGVIRKFDKKISIIYDASSTQKNHRTLPKNVNAVIAASTHYLEAIRQKNHGKIIGIAIDHSDKSNVASKISEFIEAQADNIKKWKMKIHFLTFASSNFKTTLSRIKAEAESSGFFDTITCLTELDLPIKYRMENQVNQQSRGFGYWIWKSYITYQLLSKIEDGDILVYADGGCSINAEGRKRFYEYIEMLSHSKISNLSFQMAHPEKHYTKGDLLKHFDVINNEKVNSIGQLVGGIFFIRKDKISESLIQEWYSTCHDHRNLIDDSTSSQSNDPAFIEHRHDQSIFSILRKLRGSIILEEETYFYNWERNRHFPIHARRWKS